MSTPKTASQVRSNITLLFLIAFHFIGGLIWILWDNAVPTWDEAGHIIKGLEHMYALREGLNIDILRISDYYPPASYFLYALSNLFISNTIVASRIVSLLLLILTITVTYKALLLKYSLHITNITTILFSFFPATYNSGKLAMTEILMLFFLSLLLYLNFRVEKISSQNSVLIGAVIGLGMLSRWLFIVYIPFQLIAKYLYAIKQDILNYRFIFFTIFAAITIAGSWYFTNLEVLLPLLIENSTPELSDPVGFSPANLSYLFDSIKYDILLGPIILLVPFLLFASYKSKKARYLLTNIIVIYLAITLLGNKNGRYIWGIIPILTAWIAETLSTLEKHATKTQKKALNFFLFMTLIISATNYINTTLRPHRDHRFKFSLNIPLLGPATIYYSDDSNAFHSYNRESNIPLSVFSIMNDYDTDDPTLLILVDKIRTHRGAFGLYSLISDEHQIGNVWNYYDSSWKEEEIVKDIVKNIDFIFTSEISTADVYFTDTGEIVSYEGSIRNIEEVKRVRKIVENNPDLFTEVSRFDFPYHSPDKGILYRVNKQGHIINSAD